MKKETGLMFKAPLVLAILAGQKTQTRRIIKNQPFDVSWSKRDHEIGYVTGRASQGDEADGLAAYTKHGGGTWCAKSPVGQPGDRIYVREAHAHHPEFAQMAFRADGEEFEDADGFLWEPKWTPAIHMKKEEARIWLEITGVRVERLQSITRADIKAEGVEITEPRAFSLYGLNAEQRENMRRTFAAYQFQELWDSTTGRPKLPENKNSKRYARVKHWLDTHPDTTGWAANPWVWAIDFKTISTTGRPA